MAAFGSLLSGGSGGGVSASSSASTGPQRSGDIGGSQFSFGGINTGSQSSASTTTLFVLGAILVVGVIYAFVKR